MTSTPEGGRRRGGAVHRPLVAELLEDIAAWDWADARPRRLAFAADIPKLDRPLPRVLSPDVDARLMAAIDKLDDQFARTGLRVLRGS